MSKVFLSQLQENNGEVYIELAPELLGLLDWGIGDVVGFKLDTQGVIQVYNLTKGEQKAGHLDTTIEEHQEEYEEEIDLYTTYGGD